MQTTALGDVSSEIDDTLRHSRDRLENQVAHYRLIGFTGIFGVSFLTWLLILPPGSPLAPVIFFAVTAVYAGLMRWFVRKRGAVEGAIYLAVLADLLVMALPGIILRPFSVYTDTFTIYLLEPGLMLVLLINVLRNHPRSMWLGAVIAALMFLGELTWIGSPRTALPMGALVLLVTGWIGSRAAVLARTNLDDFARLRLLRRFLPSAAVHQVLSEDPSAVMKGRLVTVTLVSTDLRNFTAMSEKVTPQALVEQLNEYHGVMLEQVRHHGGMLDKFMGDGALIIFGLRGMQDVPPADHGANAALHCARDMLAALEKLNLARVGRQLAPLAMGIGVHTGEVVCGVIGAEHRVEFTVIGDAVNTASRLEGLTKSVGTPLAISAETAARLDSQEGLRELPPAVVKGKDAPVRLFAGA